MHLLLVILPPSIVGAVAIILCLAPRSGIAAESATTLTRTSTAASYVAAGNAVFLGLTANEFAALGGLFVAVLSLIIGQAVNVWFKYQHLQLARAKVGAPLCETCDKRIEGDDGE